MRPDRLYYRYFVLYRLFRFSLLTEEDLDGDEDEDDEEDVEGEGEVLDGSGQNGRRAPGKRSLGIEDLVGDDLPDDFEVSCASGPNRWVGWAPGESCSNPTSDPLFAPRPFDIQSNVYFILNQSFPRSTMGTIDYLRV